MANGLFRNSLHLVSQLRYVRVSRRLHAMQCDGIRFDLMPRVLALFLILLFFSSVSSYCFSLCFFFGAVAKI